MLHEDLYCPWKNQSNKVTQPDLSSAHPVRPVLSRLSLLAPAAQGAGRAGNEVQGVIYGLMQGNTSALEGVLDNLLAGYGVSTNNTFAEIGAALAAGPAHAAAAEAVGVQALPEDLALAA